MAGQVGESSGRLAGNRPRASRGVTFSVQAEDLQASLGKAESLGGKAVMTPTRIPRMGSIAMIQDLEENAIGLFKG